MVNHIRGGGRSGFETLVTDIHQQNGWCTFIMGWSKVLHFKIENTRIKDTNGKRKFKRMFSFLFASLPRSRFLDVTQRSPKSSRSFGERCGTSKNGCEGDYLFVDKRELFAMKLSFEVFNLVFCTADQSAWLVLNQPRQRGFWRNLRYILYSMVKERYVFKREF